METRAPAKGNGFWPARLTSTVKSHMGSLRRDGSAFGLMSRTVLPIGEAVVMTAVPCVPVARIWSALPLIVRIWPLLTELITLST